jgi:hypothetical protein
MFGWLTIWVRRLGVRIRYRAGEIVRRAVRKLVETVITDLDLMWQIRGVMSSAEFEHDYLSRAKGFKGRSELLGWALDQVNDNDGLFLEFGVYKGDSLNLLADLKSDVTWHGFDSFVGLPEDWSLGAKAGAFDVKHKLPPVRSNVRLVSGFFDKTLETFLAQNPGKKVAFLHVDCDLYSSTKTVLFALRDRLVPGSIILFDELINYPGWQDQEYRAFMEYVAEQNVSFEYIGYVRTSCRVAVKLTGATERLNSTMENSASRAYP